MSEQTPDQTAERINQLEEQIAHLTRAVDDMSEIVTRQEDEITAPSCTKTSDQRAVSPNRS